MLLAVGCRIRGVMRSCEAIVSRKYNSRGREYPCDSLGAKDIGTLWWVSTLTWAQASPNWRLSARKGDISILCKHKVQEVVVQLW